MRILRNLLIIFLCLISFTSCAQEGKTSIDNINLYELYETNSIKKIHAKPLGKSLIASKYLFGEEFNVPSIKLSLEGKEYDYALKRHIEIENGNTELTFTAFRREKNRNEWQEMSLNSFNEINKTEYEKVYELPYEVLINIDIGQDFFKDSIKFLNEEMEVYNTLCEEVQKTKTRIATTQHYQSGDMFNQWQPSSNIYDVKTISVGNMQDYFTLLPGDKVHSVFEFLQGNLRVNDYIDTFKFCDYQVILMANLSPATFGYEKDNYQYVARVDLSMNLTDMTIEAIKKQIEPQVNHLIENVVKLQE